MLKIFQPGSATRTPIEQANWIQTKFLVGWGGLLGFAILFSALGAAIGQDSRTHSFQVFWQVLAIGMVVAGACAMVAWLLGLLFGIPKSIATLGVPTQAPNSAPANSTQSDSRQPTSRVNTNLEDVSDWLTKTLIGVGLTQLTSLPHTLWHYATILDQASLKSEGGGAVFILSVAAAGGAGGFWVGYVTTRTFLTLLFDLFDKPQIGDVTAAADPANLTLGADQKPVPSTDPVVKAADQKLRSFRLDQLSAPMDIAAWGAAQARALNLGTALQAVRQAADAAPNNDVIKALLAKVEQANKGGS